MPHGTVKFDELSRRVYIGRIIQAPGGTGAGAGGRLIFDNNEEQLAELTFGERDRIGEYTLLDGDFVQFRIATDKRQRCSNRMQSQQYGVSQSPSPSPAPQRATQITLIEEHSLVENSANTKECRGQGVLIKLFAFNDKAQIIEFESSDAMRQHEQEQLQQFKAKYGAIKTLEHDNLVFFALNELIQYVRFTTGENNAAEDTSSSSFTYEVNDVVLEIGDSIEFSIVKCVKEAIFQSGFKAIRVRQLAKSAAAAATENVSPETYTGIVEREAQIELANSSAQTKKTSAPASGIITYEYKNGSALPSSKSIEFYLSCGAAAAAAGEVGEFYKGDKVQFNICQCLKTKRTYAKNIKLLEAHKEQGYVTMLKEPLGCIELGPNSAILTETTVENESVKKLPQREFYFHFRFV